MDLDDIKDRNSGDRPLGMGDIASVYKFPEKKWVSIRLIPGVQPEASYWVKTTKKDGKFTKFSTPCPSFDFETQERDSTKYDPWREVEERELSAVKAGEKSREDMSVSYASNFWMNAIIRQDQKN
jgi:hypothetical protein